LSIDLAISANIPRVEGGRNEQDPSLAPSPKVCEIELDLSCIAEEAGSHVVCSGRSVRVEVAQHSWSCGCNSPTGTLRLHLLRSFGVWQPLALTEVRNLRHD
jgi:hypothetical protein